MRLVLALAAVVIATIAATTARGGAVDCTGDDSSNDQAMCESALPGLESLAPSGSNHRATAGSPDGVLAARGSRGEASGRRAAAVDECLNTTLATPSSEGGAPSRSWRLLRPRGGGGGAFTDGDLDAELGKGRGASTSGYRRFDLSRWLSAVHEEIPRPLRDLLGDGTPGHTAMRLLAAWTANEPRSIGGTAFFDGDLEADDPVAVRALGDGSILEVRSTDAGLDTVGRRIAQRTAIGGLVAPLEAQWVADSRSLSRLLGVAAIPRGQVIAIPASLSTEARAAAGPRVGCVSLDVVEDRAVLAASGFATVYVEDYDVEISQATNIARPIFDVAQGGLSLAAWVTSPGVPASLDVAARRVDLPVSLATFSCSLAGGEPGLVTIELPPCGSAVGEFRGPVAWNGTDGAVLGLSDGSAVLLFPTALVAEMPRGPTMRVMQDGVAPLPDDDDFFGETYSWSLRRVDDGASSDVAGSTASGRVVVELERSTRWGPSHAIDVDAVLRGASPLAAPFTVELVAGPTGTTRRVDATVSLSRPSTTPPRDVAGFASGQKEAIFHLPRVLHATTSVRFHLARGETRTRELALDLGEGAERWRLTLARDAK